MNMFTELFRLFKKPSAALLAQSELEDAQRELLAAETGLDYARCVVDYNKLRVERLTYYIRTGDTRASLSDPSPSLSEAPYGATIARPTPVASPTR